MKSALLISLLLMSFFSYGRSPLETIKAIKSSHPEFLDAVVNLQSEYLKDRKWENVLGISYVYRTKMLKGKDSFRVDPFLMEAYSLIQFCRYKDARAVLNAGKFYAESYGSPEDLRKVEKANELEKLSQFYKNLSPPKSKESNFSLNELQWDISTESDEVLQIMDQVIIRTDSLCK